MRWFWQRRARTIHCTQPRMLRCATPGIHFQATFTIEWRPALRARPNLEDLVLSRTLAWAGEVAQLFPAIEVRTAQDTINAELGAPEHTRATGYRCLAARVELALSESALEDLAQQQADEARVRRLRFLRTNLYEQPDLFVLDRIEQQCDWPGAEQVAEWQRLARWMVAADEWWQPMLDQWEKVGQGFNDIELQNRAMLALCDALQKLKGDDASDDASVPSPGAAEGQRKE
ncbi:hypothetical protein ACFYXP_10430 [Streptomyces sp. NPDC002466]|uniref:hypothetical protein n=1 Tax=unclassified Streptomyces TaxID=2593676 RepID=UPI0011E681A7|nr:hypothetical protein [Streptomyces sp. sk2.1]TXS71637.1 hypothetical protein EAO76_21285 [Streptomyces sp. sk2.1]